MTSLMSKALMSRSFGKVKGHLFCNSTLSKDTFVCLSDVLNGV